MNAAYRLVMAAMVVVALAPAPARGEEAGRLQRAGADASHACLDQKERRVASESGWVVQLVTAMRVAKRRMPGTVVRARLCRGEEGLVYVLTVLARDGRVARLTVDAVKGTFVGQR